MNRKKLLQVEESDLRFQISVTLFSLLWGRPWKRERHKWGKEKEWESEERVCWKISLIPKQTPVSHMKVRAAFLSSRTATQVLYCARVWVPLFQPVPMIQLDRKLWNSQPAHSSHSNSLAKHTLSLSFSFPNTLSLSLSLSTPSPTHMLHTVSSQLYAAAKSQSWKQRESTDTYAGFGKQRSKVHKKKTFTADRKWGE